MSRRLMGTVLIFLGVLLAIFGFYASFEIYVKDKLSKNYETMGYFLIKTLQGEVFVDTPDKFGTIITLKTPEGKVYATQNTTLPVDKKLYYHFERKIDNYHFSLYTKNLSLFEYLEYVLHNIPVIGISLSGFLFIVIGIYVVSSLQVESRQASEMKKPLEEANHYDEKLIKRLKALRIALTTSKIIPEESLEEAKNIIDSILNISGGKK